MSTKCYFDFLDVTFNSRHFYRHILVIGGDVLLDGAHFEKVPRVGITIATWIKLDTNKGVQSMFDTVGSHSKHKDGQYHLEIENGKVRWFHRNENHDTIFSVQTRPVVREGVWTQITVTYSAKKQRARVSSVIRALMFIACILMAHLGIALSFVNNMNPNGQDSVVYNTETMVRL